MMSAGIMHIRRAIAAFIMLASGVASANPAPWQLNMSPGATKVSAQVYQIHMISLWICCIIGVIVFGAMIIAMIRFRKSKGAVAATWSHNTTAEVIWTVIPVLILIGMAWPATKLLIEMADTEKSDMTIKITGYQWKWRYEYVDYFKQTPGVNFISSIKADSDRVRQLGSGLDPLSVQQDGQNTYLLDVDKPLVIPVGVKVRFVVTADDVIHSWWVPSLGWKQDAIPGIINDAWTQIDQPGTYRGQCAELCGKDHGFMPIVVVAKPKLEFETWLAEQQQAAANAKAPATTSTTTQPVAPAAQG